jgi:hypothetical protein
MLKKAKTEHELGISAEELNIIQHEAARTKTVYKKEGAKSRLHSFEDAEPSPLIICYRYSR